jgi:hypothetical protein
MLTAKNEIAELIPAGTHVARCIGVIDLGTQYSEKFGNSSRKVLVKWELPNELMDDGKPVGTSKKYTLSLNEKANLKKDLESWLGRGITEDEQKEGFALGALLGKTCFLSIVHAQSGDKTYANIAGVMSVPKGTVVPEQSNPMVSYDVENGKDAVFAKLPEWIRTMIEQSKEFKDGDEPETEEVAPDLSDTGMPFEFDAPAEPAEPAAPPEVYVYGPKQYSRGEWLESLHQAATLYHLTEPVDINAMGRDDLQAAGKILITQMQAACASKKKAEKKIS